MQGKLARQAWNGPAQLLSSLGDHRSHATKWGRGSRRGQSSESGTDEGTLWNFPSAAGLQRNREGVTLVQRLVSDGLYRRPSLRWVHLQDRSRATRMSCDISTLKQTKPPSRHTATPPVSLPALLTSCHPAAPHCRACRGRADPTSLPYWAPLSLGFWETLNLPCTLSCLLCSFLLFILTPNPSGPRAPPEDLFSSSHTLPL